MSYKELIADGYSKELQNILPLKRNKEDGKILKWH